MSLYVVAGQTRVTNDRLEALVRDKGTEKQGRCRWQRKKRMRYRLLMFTV